jgi:rod shape determining protein RodA
MQQLSFKITDKYKDMPICMVVIIAVLIFIGALVMYDASEGQYNAAIFKKQLIYSSVFFLLMLATSLIEIRFFFNNAYIFYVLSLMLLITVDVVGHKAMGATRWLNLGFIKIQPSEIIKVSLVLALARYFHFQSAASMNSLRVLIFPILLFAVPFVIILKQPDLGTAIILLIITTVIFFLAGVPIKYFLVSGGALLLTLPIAIKLLHGYQKTRLLIFLNPETDPLGAGYNILQSKIAIGSGGLFGKGRLQSTQAQLDFLPEHHTDFVFSLFAEEYGFAGSIGLIGLFLWLIYIGYRISIRSKQQFGRLVAFGLISVFSINVFINLGMVTGMLPVVGVPLPFLSYGGSSMATVLISFGILMNIGVNYSTALPTKFGNG